MSWRLTIVEESTEYEPQDSSLAKRARPDEPDDVRYDEERSWTSCRI